MKFLGKTATALGVASVLTWCVAKLLTSPIKPRKPQSTYSIPETSCGPVSIYIVNHLFGSTKSVEYFSTLVNPGEFGTCSFHDMITALTHEGFSAEAIKFEKHESPVLKNPTIIRLDRYHFVVIVPRGDGTFVLVDPPEEPIVKKWEELQNRWDGEAIIIGKTPNELETELISLGIK